MDLVTVTDIFVYIATAIIILYDIVPAVNDKPGDTISERAKYSTRFTSLVPYGMGILFGHFFGPFRSLDNWIALTLIPLSILYLGLDLIFREIVREKIFSNKAFYSIYMLVGGAIGYVLGSILWSLN